MKERLFFKKDDFLNQFHSRRGLALFIVWSVWGIVGFILSLIPSLSAMVSVGYLTLFVLAVISLSKFRKANPDSSL